jgi:hypothetical protein
MEPFIFLEGLDRGLRALSSGSTRSIWLTPKAGAISNNVTMVGLRRPRSRPLMYCWYLKNDFGYSPNRFFKE